MRPFLLIKIKLLTKKLEGNGKKSLISEGVFITVKNETNKDEVIGRIQTAVKLIYHPIAVPQPRRKEFLKGMLEAAGLLNKHDKPLMSVRQLSEWLHVACCLRKAADNQEGITRESIETELYDLMKKNA